MSAHTVSIIGAGPAGLTTAYFLGKHKIRSVIFECGQDIGGLAGSVRLWGKSFDIGPHIFLESSQPEAVRFWKEIGGHDLQYLVLSRGMIIEKRMIRFPPSPGGLARAIGFSGFCAAALGALAKKLSKKKEVKNAADFFRNYYGNYFLKLVFNPFCEKYMGIPATKVDAGFATGLTSFVKQAGKTDVQPEKEKLKTLLYHKQGTKMMWASIAEKVKEHGEILFEKKITKILTKDNRLDLLCFSDGSFSTPDFVVSTLPLAMLLRLIDNCPSEVLEEIPHLESRNTVLVYLRLNSKAFVYQYITIFDHSLEAGRITNFNSWQKEKPTNGETVLCVEYWCNDSDKIWKSTDKELGEKAIIELEHAGILDKNKVLAVEVLRLPNSHPILNTGYLTSLEKINTYLAQFKNLALAGRQGTFKWDGQADNIIAGMKLAEKIAAHLL